MYIYIHIYKSYTLGYSHTSIDECTTTQVPYRQWIEQEEQKQEEKCEDDQRDAVPLVVLPEDVSERLPRREDPQEGGGGATVTGDSY